jgi:DNA-directed RNA polymerase specialized sigma24 family protein
VLHELSEFTVEEVAELQRCSVSAVKSRLVRGRAAMRASYEPRRPRTPTETVHG